MEPFPGSPSNLFNYITLIVSADVNSIYEPLIALSIFPSQTICYNIEIGN